MGPGSRAFRDSNRDLIYAPDPESDAPLPADPLRRPACGRYRRARCCRCPRWRRRGDGHRRRRGRRRSISRLTRRTGSPTRSGVGTPCARRAFETGNARALVGATVSARGLPGAGAVLRVRSAKPGRDVTVRKRTPAAPLGAWSAGDERERGWRAAPPPRPDQRGGTPVSQEHRRGAVQLQQRPARRRTRSPRSATPSLDGSRSLKAFYEEESKGRLAISGDGLRLVHDRRDDRRLRLVDVAHTGLERGQRRRGQPELVHQRDVRVPHTSECGWAGLGYVPGQYTYINGTLERPGHDPRARPQLRPGPQQRARTASSAGRG